MPDIKADFVSLLAFLPGGVCKTWRVCVFTKALQSWDECVLAAAIQVFPVLLHHLGKGFHSLIGTTLLCVNLLFDQCRAGYPYSVNNIVVSAVGRCWKMIRSR